MPQLIKGGIYIFALPRVGAKCSIDVPLQAMGKYGLKAGDSIIIRGGSRLSIARIVK